MNITPLAPRATSTEALDPHHTAALQVHDPISRPQLPVTKREWGYDRYGKYGPECPPERWEKGATVL